MRKFGVTFWFYAKEHFKTKSLIVLAIFFAATVGISFAISHFGGSNIYDNVAIVVNTDSFVVHEEMLQDLTDVHFHFVNSESDARQMLEDGDVSDVFIISGEERPILETISLHHMALSSVELTLTHLLTEQQTLMTIMQYELPESAVMELLLPVEVSFEQLGEDDVTNDIIAADIIGGIFPWMIYMLVLISGQMVANSVAAEKASRVMEVMLGKVHPTLTMLAKVLSSFIGMILPMLMILLGTVVSAQLGFIELESLFEFINEFIPTNVLILAFVVLFLGYFCFIFLFAAAGALAASIESLTTALAPLIYAVLIPTFLPMFLDLDHIIMNILVYIPFTSPFIIVQRYLRDYSSTLEVGISLVLMATFAVVALIVSARIYMNGVSHTSEKISLKDLKKMLQK